MKRRLLRILTTISLFCLLVLLGSAVPAFHRPWSAQYISFVAPEECYIHQLEVRPLTWSFHWEHQKQTWMPPPAGVSLSWVPVPRWSLPNPDSQFLGFGFMRYGWSQVLRQPVFDLEGFTVQVPTLVLLLLLSIVPARWMWNRRATRRTQRMGLCPACSYDLRAHKPGGKCPECGSPVTSPTLPTIENRKTKI